MLSFPLSKEHRFLFVRSFLFQTFQGMLCLISAGRKKIPFYNPYCYLQVHPLFGKAESKNKLLRSVAGGGVEQIGQLQARWDKFEMMMESHELMVKEQVGKATF